MSETARRTKNQGFTEYHGPVSGKMLRDVVELRALADEMPVNVRERVNKRLNAIIQEIDRVAGLENAALALRRTA